MVELQQKHIEKLDGNTLPILLNKLLRAECTANNIPLNSIHCTLPDRICIQDGGADGILINNLPQNTDFLFSGNMIFQVKATSIEDISSEINKKNIQQHIKSGGSYILFCNKLHCEGYNTLNKENEFKQQIANTLNLSINNVNFRLYDHSQIASWVDKYYSVKVWLLNTIGEYNGVFKDFATWQLDSCLCNPLKTNDNLLQSIKNIGMIICSNPIVRIEGQSGTGKTRQLLEAIKIHEEIQNLVLYTDQITDRFNEIYRDIDFVIKDKQRAVVILDDCPYDDFIKIKDMLSKIPNNITFISLDYETENNKKSLISYERINLPYVDDEVIKEMLLDYYHDINNGYFQKLVELCGKNPRMAQIVSLYADDCLDFSACIEESNLEKLSKTRRKDEKLSKVLEACSLFKTIYYTQENDSELLEIASLAELSDSETLKCFNKLKDTLRVIQARYEYHYVIPQILAFQMLLAWLKNSSSTLKNKLHNLPNRMKQSFYEQIEELNQYPQVTSLAERLIVPFANREMLNSKFGSECFLRLSNIVPGIALKKLQETFSSFSQNDYLQIKDGRRAIVCCLQIIAFHKEYFNEAAEIMLALADAENESWSNNATGEFIDFFKLYLGGTTCPAIDRLLVIRKVLSDKNNLNKLEICLNALDKALTLGFFSRSSGPEQQGSIKLQDWHPQTINDIHTYIQAVLDILQNLIFDMSFPLRQKAKDIIGQNLRWLLQYKNFDDIIPRLMKLIEFDNSGWDNARIALNHFYQFDIKKNEVTADEIKKIRQLDNALSPKNLAERIRFYITSKSSWNIYYNKKSDEEVINEYIPLLEKDEKTLDLVIPDLNENNNYLVFLLGKKLAQYFSEDKIEQIINNSVNHLLFIQKTRSIGDCSFLAGILNGIDDNLIDNYIKTWSLKKETAILVLILSRGLKHSNFRYNQLVMMINKYDWDEYLYFYMPLVGKSSYTDEYNDIFNLIVALKKKSSKGSLQAIVQILYNILYNNKEIPEPLRQIASDIISDWKTLKRVDNSGLYEHECKELWHYCYNKLSTDKKYAVLSQILRHLADREEVDTFFKHYASDLIKEQLEKQSIIVLQAIFDFCSQNDYNFIYFNIYLSNNFGNKEKSYIDNFNWDILKSFMDKSKEFSLFVAKNIALFEKDNLSENFINILENYIDDEEMMSALKGNIYNFSWVGNVSSYYLKVKNALVLFSEHSSKHIKEWINNTIKELDNDIKREQKNEELFSLGIRNLY